MRRFYADEAPIDTLLQIAEGPVWDGDLVSKRARDAFVQLGWVARWLGWNIITAEGRSAVAALALERVWLTADSDRDTAPGEAMNSLKATEAASAAVAVAPRVSLVDIEGAIAHRFDLLAGNAVGVLPGEIPPLNVLSICILVMKNGFTVIGKSAPAAPENFNRELGRQYAYEDAVRQLWPLMGYALRDRLAAA